MYDLQQLFSQLKKITLNRNTQPEQVATIEELIKLSQDHDGHKRENAVLRLGMMGDPVAFPCLIIRVNDWVPQVRYAAVKALSYLMVDENVEAIIQCLPQVYHLQDCHRANHQDVIRQVEALLLTETNRGHLLAAVQSANSYVARLCLNLVIEHQVVDAQTLLPMAFSSKDVLVRAHAFRWSGIHYPQVLEKHYLSLLNDKFMPIRKAVLKHLLMDTNNAQVAEKGLVDRHSSVRELAVKHCQANGNDVVAFYREHLTKDISTKAAIWGLGYLKCVGDLDKIKYFHQHGTPSLRKQALNSLLKLDSHNRLVYLLNGLRDPSPSVCKESARLMVKTRVYLNAKALMDIICGSEHPHTARACVALSHQINKWERVVFLLMLMSNEQVVSMFDEGQIKSELANWGDDYNRSFSQPTQAQIDEIRVLMAGVPATRFSERFSSFAHALKTLGIH
ncbi:HEAT repeat domain-containing protein [Pseudoalteromonas rubra]|uniref:HEAT repeat domain-containing protein n=1 Tax=Pseudoalteromonas rubra TaxID=43658 RepID=A0A0U3GVL5_9GAMM|nr:HEAT repeat domain-containing protein [Pseudoalteromonas rubra]ALU43155.1 hypothetical protein AT705_09495 [Pseudoalteromonas rubra]